VGKVVGITLIGSKIEGTCDAAPQGAPATGVVHLHKDTSAQDTSEGLDDRDLIQVDVKNAFKEDANLIRALRTCKWKEPGNPDRDIINALIRESSSPSKKFLVLDIDRALMFSANEDSIEEQTADEKSFGRPDYILPQRSGEKRFV
jgi:hypothetical protein